MEEIIKIKNQGYAEYEELLLERDQIRKEAGLLKIAYTKIFGELIARLFEMKITCIKKKKILHFCQAEANKGKTVDLDAMMAQINREMREYDRKLAQMIAENNAANASDHIGVETLAKIKKLYHRLAKMLHPDINPKTDVNPQLKQLWHMIVVSYNANNLEELEAAEVLVKKALENAGWETIEIEIDDLPGKIQKVRDEMMTIKGKNPYQYKFLLENEKAVEEKKESLQREMQEYAEYEKELDALMDQFLTGEVDFKWTMK